MPSLPLNQLSPEEQAEVLQQFPEAASQPKPTQDVVDALNPTELADFLKDPKGNGGFTLEQWLSQPANRDRFERDAQLQDKISEAQLIHDEERFSSAFDRMTKSANAAPVATVAKGLFAPIKAGYNMAKGALF